MKDHLPAIQDMLRGQVFQIEFHLSNIATQLDYAQKEHADPAHHLGVAKAHLADAMDHQRKAAALQAMAQHITRDA